MPTEIKRAEVGPNADALTSLTRGRGPRRGNLEELLKYWRPIMKKPGGFRRCVVILMDKPQFGGKPQRICAWLHHELTGKWPNEGNHHGRGGKRRKRRVSRTVRGAARRAKSDVLTQNKSFDVSPLRIAVRESRDFGGVLVQPIAGRQAAVEMKAAMFAMYSERYVVNGTIEEKRVGLFGSSSRAGQAAQAAGSIILPGDISDIRSPIRSQIYETLTPGGGRGLPSARRVVRGRGGRGARNKFRCPPGFEKGGTFTNSQFSTCGAQILGIPSKGVGSPSSGAQRALAALARDASLVREIGYLRNSRNPYDIIRAAQIPVAPKKGSPTRRQISINNVLARAEEQDFSIRAVRRDGVILEPVVSVQALGKMNEFDDLADGTLIDSYASGQIGSSLFPAFSTGLRDVYVDIPESGAVRIKRVGGELSQTERDSLRRVFPTSLRRAADLPDPSAAIRDYADSSDGRFVVEFGELKNGNFEVDASKNELIRVQTAGGKTLTVPRWVYETFLSRSAPRRAKDAEIYEILSDEKAVNPFFISTKGLTDNKMPNASYQEKVNARAMLFTQMSDVSFKARGRGLGRVAPSGGRTRALFDPNLNRYRCPPGTRYGGRISDKFGRNCGYSLPRQIVNLLVDVGVTVEEAMDRRKRRRRGVDTEPGDRRKLDAGVRTRLDNIFERLDNLEKEMDIAFGKVEDARPGRVGPTIGERRQRRQLTERESDLLKGNELADALEELGNLIDSENFDDASPEEIREAFRRVEKLANLEAGRLTEAPPRTDEDRSIGQRILDAIARVLRRLADMLDGGGRDRSPERRRGRDRVPGDDAPRRPDGADRRRRVPRDRDRGEEKPSLDDVLDRIQARAADFDQRSGGMTQDFVNDLDDAELDDFIRGLEDNLDDLGEEGRDMLGRLRAERDLRRGRDNDVVDVLNDMQAQQEAFDRLRGGKTDVWINNVNDQDLDRFIDALERADKDMIGEEGAEMLRNLIAERDRRNRPPRSEKNVLDELQRRAEDFDVRSGGMTADFVNDLDDAELARFIDGLRRFDLGEEGQDMLNRLIAERDLRKRPPHPGRRRREDINIGRRAVGGRNRRQNIEEFDNLTPDQRRNLEHQAALEFDELADEWRKALGADDLNGFTENDMRQFVARKIQGNDPDARLWRRRYNDYLELNELNRKLEAAEGADEIDEALREHGGRLAAHRRSSLVAGRDANAADRPSIAPDPKDVRGGDRTPPNDVNELVDEVRRVNGAGNMSKYDDAELNDRFDRVDAEMERYVRGGEGPPPRKLAEAHAALRNERERRNAERPNQDGGAGIPDAGEQGPQGIAQRRIDAINNLNDEELQRVGDDILRAAGDGLEADYRREQLDPFNDTPDDLVRARGRVVREIARRQQVREFQIDRPLRERDDNAVGRQLEDLRRLEVGVPAGMADGYRQQIAELEEEVARRENLRVNAANAADNAPGANSAVVRRLLSSDWRSIRQRKDAKRQAQINDLAERRYGEERPFDLKVGENVGVDAFRQLSDADKRKYIRQMYSHGIAMDGGTTTVNGVTYRKEVVPNVRVDELNGDSFSVTAGMRMRVYRLNDDGSEVIVADEMRGYNWPNSGFKRYGSVGGEVKHSMFGVKTYWDPATGRFVPGEGRKGEHVDFRGGGIASELNANAILFYRGVGIDKVGVSAADDGIAVWPAQAFRDASPTTIRNLNSAMRDFVNDARGFREAVAEGRVPTPKQIHVGMILRQAEAEGDSDPLERLDVLVQAGIAAGDNADNMPGHYEYIQALSPVDADGNVGRNLAAFNLFKGVSMASPEERADMQEFLNQNNINVDVAGMSFDGNNRAVIPTFSAGYLDITGISLPTREAPSASVPQGPEVPEGLPTQVPARKRAFIRGPVDAYNRFLGRGNRNNRAVVVDAVPVGANGINSSDDAVAYMAQGNGGQLADVPDQFLRDAILNNPDRFSAVGRGGGVNGMMRFRDNDTGQMLGVKFSNGGGYGANEAYGEMVGNALAERLGFPVGQIRMDGPADANDSNPTPTVIVDLAQNVYGLPTDDNVNMRNPIGADGRVAGGVNSHIRMTILDMITGNSDRHAGNFFRIRRDGARNFDLYPIDFGLGGPAGLYSPDDVRGVGMDNPDAVGRMRRWRDNYMGGGRNVILGQMGVRVRRSAAERERYRREVEKALTDLRANHRAIGGLQEDIDNVVNVPGHAPAGRQNFDIAMGRVNENYEWFINASTDDVMNLLFP